GVVANRVRTVGASPELVQSDRPIGLSGARDRWFADSPLEESRCEPLVPVATEMLIELARGISNQLGCWRSATWGRCRGCVDSEVGPAVRIRFPPAASQQRTVGLGCVAALGTSGAPRPPLRPSARS